MLTDRPFCRFGDRKAKGFCHAIVAPIIHMQPSDRAASEKWYTTARRFLRRRDVRFGSLADIGPDNRHVRFTPESRH